MITIKQLKIFEIFARSPFREHTRTEIKKELKQKSNNSLALAINLLKKEEVILEKKIGKSGILTVNINNDLTFYYIALCNYAKLNQPIKLAIENLKKEIDENTAFYSIVIFGSYSISQQKKDSDLDIAIFIENEENKKQIEALTNSAKLKSIIELDIHIISKSEMIQMLTNKEENLGKQIARKHLAIYNHKIFYDIVRDGMNGGFRI